MSQRDAVVIGSGIAGMAAAIRLSLQGFRVQVFERNAHPGGKLSLIEKDGFRFDAGPSLFTQPHHLTELFEMAGVPVDASVAAILRPIWPVLPKPQTTTRPWQARMRSTA